MYYLKRFTDANYWLQVIAKITKQIFSSHLGYFWSTHVNLARIRTGNEQFPQQKKFPKKPFRTPSKSVFAIYKHVLKRKLKRMGTEITQETIWKWNQGGEGISFTMSGGCLGSVTREKGPRVAEGKGQSLRAAEGVELPPGGNRRAVHKLGLLLSQGATVPNFNFCLLR